MKFQIAGIILYSYDDRIRTLKLHPDSVNIITGPTGTGKSSLLDIVDYCLGSNKNEICYGVISDRVAWFGLLLQLETQQFFIARRNPYEAPEDIFVQSGKHIAPPRRYDLRRNIGREALLERLNEFLGIQPHVEEVLFPLEMVQSGADIRKALVYCFQGQSEVANKDTLFHGTGTGGRGRDAPQVRQYFPYFIGAIDTEILQRRALLKKLEKEERTIRMRLKEKQRLLGDNFERAFALLTEAKQAGLLPPSCKLEHSWGALRPLFLEALSAQSLQDYASLPDISLMYELREECRELRLKGREEKQRLQELEALWQCQRGCGRELNEQHARLESLGLYSYAVSNGRCPLCNSSTAELLPTRTAVAKELARLEGQLDQLEKDSSYFRNQKKKIEKRIEEIGAQLQEKNAMLRALEANDKNFKAMKEYETQCAYVRGRLALYVQTIPDWSEDDGAEKRLDALLKDIAQLRAQTSSDIIEEREYHILQGISSHITNIMRKLEKSHDATYNLNIKRQTVEAHLPTGYSIPLARMGSGETWVAVHLATHLALHRYFAGHNRPVPQFIFFDQPSQAYYPPDTHIQNSDREAVARMFRTIKKETKGFQVIITDHVSSKDKEYQDCVRESWWEDGKKLVPQDWC